MSIIDFIVGSLTVNSLLLLWFASPLKITLGKILFKQNFKTIQDFDEYLFLNNRLLGKLSYCWICLSFWLSLAVGAVFVIGFGAPVITPLVTFLTYPGIAFLFKSFTHLN